MCQPAVFGCCQVCTTHACCHCWNSDFVLLHSCGIPCVMAKLTQHWFQKWHHLLIFHSFGTAQTLNKSGFLICVRGDCSSLTGMFFFGVTWKSHTVCVLLLPIHLPHKPPTMATEHCHNHENTIQRKRMCH